MDKVVIALLVLGWLFVSVGEAKTKRYSTILCESKEYICYKVKRGDNWRKLFPDDEQRDIVRRLNRMNTRLRWGMRIAIPKNLESVSIYDVAPFPRYIESGKEKRIFISQKHLAWGAYDADGELVWWGPISSGQDWCSDIRRSCTTPSGHFRIIRKQDRDCISSAFPLRLNGDHGGAPMPYCMHFYRGFALHGAAEVPGYRASHGCVRMFPEDAKWLNEEFVETPGAGFRGTRIIIGPPK